MPRAFADALFARLLDAFPPDAAYAPNDLARAPMPPPLAHFLTKTLRHRARRALDRWHPPASPYLDTSYPGVEEAAERYRAALLQHARFPKDEWRDALRSAARRVSAYLVRPVRTAVRYVFRGDDGALPIGRILQRMHHLAPYPYLREAVKAYADQKSVGEIDRTSLTVLLTRVDQRMTADHDAEAWLRLLGPLFVTARAAFPNEDGVPTALLHDFFRSKKAFAAARRLEAAERDGAEWMDEAALRHLLEAAPAPDTARERVASSSSEAAARREPSAARLYTAPEADAPEESKPSEAAPEPAPTPSTGEDAAEDDAAEAVPLWKRFQRGAPRAKEPAAAQQQQADRGAQSRPRWQQFRPPADAPGAETAQANGASSDEALAALERDVLGPSGRQSRALFVRHLFGGDEEAYAGILRRLREAPTWNEASRIIARDVFRARQINIYSDPAVAFTDAVEGRFR